MDWSFNSNGEMGKSMVESVRYLMFLVGMYYFFQAAGGNPGFHVQALMKYLKEVAGFSPAETAAFMAFLVIPWMVKPLYGVISDFLPIFGWRRKSYFVLMGFLAAGSYFWLSGSHINPQILSLLLFLAAIGFAFSDVLCDAVMVEKGQPLNATDRLQSMQWGMLGLAGVIIAFSKGYIAEHWTLAQALRLSMVFPVAMIFFTLFFLREQRVTSSSEAAKQARGGMKSAVCSKPLWAAALFLFLFHLNPNLGTVLYYYEKDALKFSDVLIGHIDAVGSVGFLMGTALFGLISKRLSHAMLLRAIILSGVISNLAYLFFQDTLSAFVITGFASVIGIVAFLGILTLAAKICPKYAEGTVFALLMSIVNAGSQLGGIFGGEALREHRLLVARGDCGGLYCVYVVCPAVGERKKANLIGRDCAPFSF